MTKNGIQVHVIAGSQVLKLGFNSNLTDYIIIGVQADLAYQESLKKAERVSAAWAEKKDAAIASGTPFGKSLPVWLTIEGQVKSGSRNVNHGKIVVVTEQTPFDKRAPKKTPVSVIQKIFS